MSRLTFTDALAVALITLTMRDGWRLMDKTADAIPVWQHYPLTFVIALAYVLLCAAGWRLLCGKGRWS